MQRHNVHYTPWCKGFLATFRNTRMGLLNRERSFEGNHVRNRQLSRHCRMHGRPDVNLSVASGRSGGFQNERIRSYGGTLMALSPSLDRCSILPRFVPDYTIMTLNNHGVRSQYFVRVALFEMYLHPGTTSHPGALYPILEDRSADVASVCMRGYQPANISMDQHKSIVRNMLEGVCLIVTI